MRPRALPLAALFVFAVSCTREFDHKAPCSSEFAGDPSASPELSLIARDVSGAMVALTNGGAVPVLDAPQGGDVLFAAARMKNVDSCGMTFTADLRDPGTNRVIGLEGRPVNLRL